MKVICIKNHHSIYTFFLTIDKIYEVEDEVNNSDVYLIRNDVACLKRYKKSLFMTLKEVRKQKLDKLNESSV